MKKLTLALLALALAAGVVSGNPVIRHTKICTQPAGSNPNLISCPDWNADHVVDPVALAATMDVQLVTADPNGSKTGPGIAIDTTNNQVWLSTGGTVWTALVRSDGGTAATSNAWAFLGDSNNIGEGDSTDNAVRWNNVVSNGSPVPVTSIVYNDVYANAVSEPLTLVDLGTRDLQAQVVSTPPGYSYELSFGPAMRDLISGFGVTPTAATKPWLIKFGISGVELKQFLPASTYGQATPAFNDANGNPRNAYTYWRDRTRALLATSGRTLAGIVITLGGNDGTNSTDAGNVAANMNTLAGQIRTDFGNQVAIVWVKLNVNTNVSFTSTVRSQQVTGISTIANSKLVVIDTYPLNGDLIHYGADPMWDMGLQITEAMRRLRGTPARAVTQPTVVGYGTPAYNATSATTISPRGYPLSIHGDVELLFIAAMKNSGSPVTLTTPSGWTSLGNSSQAIGGQTQEFALFSRSLTQADLDANDGLPPPVTITPGNDEFYAVRVTVRGPTLFPAVDGSVVSYAATAMTTSAVAAGGPTTTSTNDLVITFIAAQGGGASLTEHFTVANTNTSPSILIDSPLGLVTTNFGLLAVATGVKATAGAVSNTNVTPSINANPSGFTVAFH